MSKNVNKNEEDKEILIKDEESKAILPPGTRNIKDLIAPASIEVSEYEVKVEDKYARTFIVNGYPSNVSVGWLDSLYNYNGDMDVAVYIEPSDERTALDELTNQITKYESQYEIEASKGNIKNLTNYQNKLSVLYSQRSALEQNYESLFHVQTLASLYDDDAKQLGKESQKLISRLAGRKIQLMPLFLRQEDGYRTMIPLGDSKIFDYARNVNTGALSTFFPFYNSEVSHNKGIFFGINMQTGTPIFLDIYNKDILNNANMSIFGKAGTGKTFLVSLITMRSVLYGIRTVLIDPEGEYAKVTNAVNGTRIVIGPNSTSGMNVFDIEEEEELDDNGNPTGKVFVDVKNKVATLLNLIAVMASGLLTQSCKSDVSTALRKVYENIGINARPESLYENKKVLNEETGEYYNGAVKKVMPTLSDFLEVFKEDLLAKGNGNEKDELIKLYNSLLIFRRDGIYGLFDCNTSAEIDFNKAPVVTFDVSQLEESILRPIGMYVAMSWTWEKFVKKNPWIKKRIVCDEAWMLTKKTMAGSDYTADFLENCARRIRKRNGGLLVASQNFKEFNSSEQGQAVLSNTMVKIFLQQDATDIQDVQERFMMSDGEKAFLLGAKRGEALVKMNEESSTAYVYAFDFEKECIIKDYLSNNN